MVIFGGHSGFTSKKMNDVVEYDFKDGQWRELQAKKDLNAEMPKKRCDHQIIASQGCLWIFGGESD